jgi:hypothetical protein
MLLLLAKTFFVRSSSRARSMPIRTKYQEMKDLLAIQGS